MQRSVLGPCLGPVLGPVLAALAAICFAAAAPASDAPYAGQQNRTIASLSDADIAAITAGEGWGLALPAELNGWPGPAHVLYLAEPLALSDTQRAVVTRIYGLMRAEAQRVGSQYIKSERALDAAFGDLGLDPIVLAGLTVRATNALGELRMIHLAAHIETRQVLSADQVVQYQALRGYGGQGTHGAHGDHAGHGK